MRRPFILIGLGFVCAVLSPACDSASDGPSTDTKGVDTPDTAPVEAPLFAVEDLTSYPLVRKCRMSIEHDLVGVEVRINPEAADAYTFGEYPFAQDTTVVKVQYLTDKCQELVGYTAMQKGPPGTAPDEGDWKWQRLDAAGAVEPSLDPRQCAFCHKSCTVGRDFTCTDPLADEPERK